MSDLDSSDSSGKSSRSDSDSSFGSDFFDEELSTVATNDSDRTKARKREKRRRYRAKLNKLKYLQSFLKEDPPSTYRGEIQVGLFKKWCRELRDWVKRAQLNRKKSTRLAGKYLDGRGYRFYERNGLDLKKKYTLTTFFEALFDYVFFADFRMQQRDKFDTCHQGRWSVLDFLRELQEISDTVGMNEMLLWRSGGAANLIFMPSRPKMVMTLPPSLNIVTLEFECVQYERAKLTRY